MLQLAGSCFKMAVIASTACDVESEITSEKWLLHYMLGKIAEKLKKAPKVYLTHYQEVCCICFKLASHSKLFNAGEV